MEQMLLGRRTMLALGAGAALAAALPGEASAAQGSAGADGSAGAAGAAGTSGAASSSGLAAAFGELEREYAARLGVFAYDTESGRSIVHRADERFPICSVFKGIAAAAVLRDGVPLDRRIRYTKEYVEAAGYAPITEKAENVANGMTVQELCSAAVSHSDNAAANLLLREVGGPTAVTRFARSTGDGVTRLDRWEPELNSAEPWRKTDVTSPRAIGRTYHRMVVGAALAPAARELLTGWLTANTTNLERFRAGLPADWTLADKTGGGSSYGVANDAGIVWPPHRPPIVLAVLTTTYAAAGPSNSALVARAARLVAGELG